MVICIADKENCGVEWPVICLMAGMQRGAMAVAAGGAAFRGSYWFPSITVELRVSKHNPEE